MTKFELVTIKKGEIKTIDAFIQNFNSIAHNMKALSVTTYNFLLSDDKEFVKEFRMRTMDELNMSNATITNLKNAGMMYTLSDRFEKFGYTNVIYFVNAIKFFNDKYGVVITEDTQELIDKMLLELIQVHNSRIEDIEKGVEELLKLNQKELKHLIDVYTTTGVDVVEAVEESTEEAVEESTEEAVEEATEEVEVVDNKVTYLDDDINNIITMITEIEENKKMTKQAILDKLADIKDILLNETM